MSETRESSPTKVPVPESWISTYPYIDDSKDIMNLQIESKGKSISLQLPKGATVKDLKAAYAKETKKSIYRLSFKNGTERLDDDSKSLDDYGLKKDATIQFKDLGPQIGYRFVFVVEYFGPMAFVLLWATRPSLIYGAGAASTPYNWVASLGIACWVGHFLKREFETFFVHKFSRPTMPLSNLYKNCTYYWTFGAVIGYPLCSPSYLPPAETQVYAGLGIFLLSELGNLICHLMLSSLRPAEGSKKRPIPKGFLFNFVACPNYTFEVLSWVGFSIMTQLPASYVFTVVGFAQMADWALKKHREYKKSYDKEYTSLRRKAIVPFLL